MKNIPFYLIILSLIVISQSFGQEIEYEKSISIGMDKNRVLATLGLPKTRRQFPDGTDVWIYLTNPAENNSQNTYSIIFDPRGKVIEIILPKEEGEKENKVDIQVDM